MVASVRPGPGDRGAGCRLTVTGTTKGSGLPGILKPDPVPVMLIPLKNLLRPLVTGMSMRLIGLTCFALCLVLAPLVYADQCNDNCNAAYNSCTKKWKDKSDLHCSKPLRQCIDACPQKTTPKVNPCRRKCDTKFSECISRRSEDQGFFCSGPLSRCYASCP